MDSQWNALKSASENKQKCLDDAHKYVLFMRLVDDLQLWFDEVEQHLSIDDNGHDLSSCKMLLMRHENLTKQIQAQQEKKLVDLSDYVNNKENQDNFMLQKMQEALEQLHSRFENLHEPCQIRRENLDESLILFNNLHDLEDFDSWLQEKQQNYFNNAKETSSNLAETLKLVKKHDELEKELKNQLSSIQPTLKCTKQLIERKHFAYALLQSKLSDLEQKIAQFNEQCDQRGLTLRDLLECQQFIADCDEMIEWLREKEPNLTSNDYGKDDSSSMTLLKKLHAFINDLQDTQRAKCQQLIQKCNQILTSKNQNDMKKLLLRKQAELDSLFKRVNNAALEREQHLKAMLQVFEFDRECETIINWLKDQELIAASQDFGTDLEHAEVLLKKFNEFMHDVEKNSSRIMKIDEQAQSLCENKYTPNQFIDQIDEKCSFVNQLWRQLNTLAEVRRQTLDGAIEVHAFDKDCDDLITWAAEKERFLTTSILNDSQNDGDNDDSMEIGYDLASVFTLAKQQEAFENELTALSEELERLNLESVRLCKQYPETREHIETRLDDAETIYNDLVKKLLTRKDQIQYSQALFIFGNEFNEVSEWLREMLNKITSADLSTSSSASSSSSDSNNVSNAESLIKRHKEFKLEIEIQQQAKIQKFLAKSEDLLSKTRKGVKMSEIKSKIESIQIANKNLLDTWQSRQDLYEQNLEYNKLMREIKLLDTWLSSKDSFVNTDLLGDSLTSVEELIKQHGDFENMLKAMEQRFGILKQESKLERNLRELKQKEILSKQKANDQFEQEKKRDQERKKRLEQRRQDERRKTQEIMAIVASSSNQQLPQSVSIQIDQIQNNDEPTMLPQLIKHASSTLNLNSIQTSSEQQHLTVVRNKKDRNRTRSIRDKYKLPLTLPTPSIKDYLMRKQEFQKGGQRAPIREYQSCYTTIHANLL